jgi:hypothetical protein
MSMGVHIASREWDEAVAAPATAPTGRTKVQRLVLNEPMRGWAAFRTTFRAMFLEEWRETVDFARARQIILFPLLLTLITTVTTIGLQFLVGTGAAQVSDIEERTFSWDQMRVALHLPLLMFSIGMGTFAFKGQEAIMQRTGSKNRLLAAPALQPLTTSAAHFTYFVKDLVYYVLLILTPIVAGMSLGLLLDGVGVVDTPLQWGSVVWTWAAMVTTIAEGLSLAFLGSVLWLRGRPFTLIGPVGAVAVGLGAGLGLVPWDSMLVGLVVQRSHAVLPVVVGLAAAGLVGALASSLLLDDFEVRVTARKDLLNPIHARLGFLGRGTLRLLVAKEFVDLYRSGTIQKMTVSYSIPLLVLLGMAWLIDFAEAPIPINLLSYAPFLGFFGFNFYSWLTILDSPDFMNGLPLRVPQLLRAKVVVYFLATSWISLIFFVLMAWRLDEWSALPTGLAVMFANSIYIVALTAFLMGLKPNKAIFDGRIMFWFWLGTVLPLLGLFLLSFTQGDVGLYGNWWERVSEQGLDATSTAYDVSMVRGGYLGILGISGMLLLGSAVLWALIDVRWSKRPFEN